MVVTSVWVLVCVYEWSFSVSGSFKMRMRGCVCWCCVLFVFVCVCCVELDCVWVIWCPSMRAGDVVGAHGEGGCRRSIPDMGGVRWSLFCVCRIGEREVIGLGLG